MLKNQRHNEIIEILSQQGFASVKELGERLFASQPTIRRDLAYLEKQGYVLRSHGGVVPADSKTNTPAPFRRGTRTREKSNICRLAATLIKPNSMIFIDASTTAFYLSEHIARNDNVTVLTNGMSICSALAAADITVYSTGGRVKAKSEAFVGLRAETAARSFNADIMFFSSSSFSQDGVISDYSEDETSLRRTVRERSKKAVFLCDSAKFASESAFVCFTSEEIDYIVTDTEFPAELADALGFIITTRGDGAVLYEKHV